MSDQQGSGSSSPSRNSGLPNLQQQRKRAKELVRAHRRGQAEAVERVKRHLPGADAAEGGRSADRPLMLAQAQWVIAREAGFPSWPQMKHAVEDALEDGKERLDRLIEAAYRGNGQRVRRLLQATPAIAADSIHACAALGDADAALRILNARPQSALEAGGPLQLAPMVYACCSRLGADSLTLAPGRAEIARRLVELGADVNASGPAFDMIDGRRSVLAGAVLFTASPKLVKLLVDCGARGPDSGALSAAADIDEAATGPGLECLRILLASRPPQWMLRGPLLSRMEHNDTEGMQLVLESGADPNDGGGWGSLGTALHVAVLSHRHDSVLALLLDRGAELERPDRDGRTPYQIAQRIGNRAAADLLLSRGADSTLTDTDRLISACFSLDRPAAAKLAADRERIRFLRSDHQLVVWAIRAERFETLELLLEAGLDPSVAADDGHTPLHAAVAAASLQAVDLLLRSQARIDARDHRGRTPLDRALSIPQPDTRRAVVDRLLDAGASAQALVDFPSGDGPLDERLRHSGAVERERLHQDFERAADAIVSGDAETLRRMLEDEPRLVHARSLRPHGATLLHYIGANGFEEERQRTPPNAVEIAQVLIDAGAEVDALCDTYAGGPAQTTLALMASSDWPEKAGLQGDLVHALCAAGADPNGVDGDGVPLATAIGFRKEESLKALIEVGARVDNALFAAAAGDLSVLSREVDERGRLRPGAAHCRVSWMHMSKDPAIAAQQALVCAAQFGRLEAVRLLLDRGIEVNAGPIDGITAVHEASFMGKAEVVRFLLERGADPSLRERRFGSSAFGWAMHANREEVRDLLLQRMSLDIIDAVDFNYPDRVRELLDGDPNLVHGPQSDGLPLRIAAATGRLGLTRLLLERGADPQARNASGASAIDYARQNGHAAVVGLLESRTPPQD